MKSPTEEGCCQYRIIKFGSFWFLFASTPGWWHNRAIDLHCALVIHTFFAALIFRPTTQNSETYRTDFLHVVRRRGALGMSYAQTPFKANVKVKLIHILCRSFYVTMLKIC